MDKYEACTTWNILIKHTCIGLLAQIPKTNHATAAVDPGTGGGDDSHFSTSLCSFPILFSVLPCREAAPLNLATGSGERCKLLLRSPGAQLFTHFESKNRFWL